MPERCQEKSKAAVLHLLLHRLQLWEGIQGKGRVEYELLSALL